MSGAREKKAKDALHTWDVVETSRGGHERTRRLAERMTEEQARQWQADHGGKLSRVDETLVRHDSSGDARRRAHMARG